MRSLCCLDGTCTAYQARTNVPQTKAQVPRLCRLLLCCCRGQPAAVGSVLLNLHIARMILSAHRWLRGVAQTAATARSAVQWLDWARLTVINAGSLTQTAARPTVAGASIILAACALAFASV